LFLMVDFVADDAANGCTLDGSDRSATRKNGGCRRQPTPVPMGLLLSCVDIPEHAPRPSSMAAATALQCVPLHRIAPTDHVHDCPDREGRGIEALLVIPGTLLFARIVLLTLQVFNMLAPKKKLYGVPTPPSVC
jgi:hypothetical protein